MPRTEDPRQGISWRFVGGSLEVRIDLVNESSEPTETARLVIETAPLGAFVPFKPGTRVTVAGLDPWERRSVTARIAAERLDDFLAPPVERTFQAYLDLKKRGGRWAGNLNVYFDVAPDEGVEVHRALDLKVQGGERVMFTFFVDYRQAYAMDVRSSDPAWRAEVQSAGPGATFLFVVPPTEIAVRAKIEVLVTRLSDGRTVPVVFTMETVAGAGDILGCVQV